MVLWDATKQTLQEVEDTCNIFQYTHLRIYELLTQSLHFKPIINSDHIITLNISSKFRMYEALVAPYFDYCSNARACTGKSQTPEIAK